MAPAAVSAHVRPDQRYAWCGPSLLVTDGRGDCDSTDLLTGYYFHEARHLRKLRLQINGTSPWLCSDATIGHDELSFVFVFPELTEFGGGGTDVSDDTTWTDDNGLVQRSIDMRLRYRVEIGGMEARLLLANRSAMPAVLAIVWSVDADFADIQEAFSDNREQRAAVKCEPVPDGLTFTYEHSQLPLSTRVLGTGPCGWRATDHQLETVVTVLPRSSVEIGLLVCAVDRERPAVDRRDAELRLRHVARWRENLTRLEAAGSSGDVTIVQNALEDLGSLALLEGRVEGRTP